MANLIDPFTFPTTRPTDVPQHVLGDFPTYAGAERLVDTLADRGFAVAQHVRILGHGLRSVEYVDGRMTPNRAAAAGAATGAWFGLLVGLVVGLFTRDANLLGLVLSSVVVGAAWFAVFGYSVQWATHGRREFSSTKGIEAENYQVLVDQDRAEEAMRLAGLR